MLFIPPYIKKAPKRCFFTSIIVAAAFDKFKFEVADTNQCPVLSAPLTQLFVNAHMPQRAGQLQNCIMGIQLHPFHHPLDFHAFHHKRLVLAANRKAFVFRLVQFENFSSASSVTSSIAGASGI